MGDVAGPFEEGNKHWDTFDMETDLVTRPSAASATLRNGAQCKRAWGVLQGKVLGFCLQYQTV